VREQLRRRLVAFSGRRAWDRDDLDQALSLARRRARQGVALDVLIRAYHVADRELWRHLSDGTGDVQPLLPELASLMLESLQAVTSTLALAHSSETRARDRTQMAVAQRLVDLLATRSLDVEAGRLAEYLGFRLEQPFVALAYDPSRGDADIDLELEAMTSRLVVARGGVGAIQILLAQSEHNDVAQQVDSLSTATFRVGIGSAHSGISGASRSMRQAQLAFSSSSIRTKVRRFSDDWLISCVTSSAELLERDVVNAAEIATNHPSLRDTVLAFAESSMSVTGCARVSHLHANTVVYRLTRWKEMTGWDPRTFPDLAKSVVACSLANTLPPV